MKEYFSNKKNLLTFFISFIVMAIVVSLFNSFIVYIDTRDANPIYDPLLAVIPPKDMTIPNTILIYGSILLATLSLLKDPARLSFAWRVYTLMVLIRMAAMYLMPLGAPENIIPLQDPFVALFNPNPQPVQDLFFSGHTSTIALCFMVASGVARIPIFLALLIVPWTLLFQHVHYTIDIFAAPFFAYGSYRIVSFLESLRT